MTLPTPQDPSPHGAPSRDLARTVVVGAIAFAATLILLFGFATLILQSRDRGVAIASASPAPASSAAAGTGSSTPSLSASPSVGPSAAASVPGGSASSSPLPSASADPVLVGAGDIAACGLDDDSATAKLVAGIPEAAVFTAGDNAYETGSADDFRNCYDPTWGPFKDRTRPAPGNHDWQTTDLAGYLGYFGAAADPQGTSWYSYDLGTWHVVVLDSDCGSVGGCGAGSAQGRWLSADLAASTARCTLAIWHHPRFSSGFHGNDTDVAPFWKALYDAGADVVVNGHDHDYERFAPQDPNGREDRVRGIREFVVGTGGAALRPFPTTRANSELRVATTHGIIELVLHKSSYQWTFLPTTGELGDSGTAPCH
jgi:hypothetical protein